MAQDMTKMLDSLNDLIALDHDAVNAYESAIKRIGNSFICERLRQYQGDHRRHIAELSQLVRNYGGEPRQHADVKGFFIQAFTAITASMGDKAALTAMKSNEELTNKKYDQALQHAWPEAVRTIISRNRDDERRHLEFVEAQLAEADRATTAPAR
jgi:uncharacterized protein (TIGR02284 family)